MLRGSPLQRPPWWKKFLCLCHLCAFSINIYHIIALLDQTLNDLNMLASRPGSMLQNGKPGRRRCYLRYLVIEKVLLFHLFVMSSFSTHTLRRTKEVEGLKARNGNCSYIIQDKIQDKKCLICEQSLSTIFQIIYDHGCKMLKGWLAHHGWKLSTRGAVQLGLLG